MNDIEGVKIKNLSVVPDERGWLMEILRSDEYPIRKQYELRGPTLRKGASVGANATILPGVEIGEGAMVAGGALVTHDVPPWKLAIG